MSENREKVTPETLDNWDCAYADDMVRGYLDGYRDAPWPDEEPSPAYEHGRRNGVNDRTHTNDPEMLDLARALIERKSQP